MQANRIRIIGGKWRSLQCAVPLVADLRPTPNRIRETLFNWLQFDVVNKVILDAFCGSGALTLEALSRGAKTAYALDIDAVVISNLTANLKKLCAENAYVHQQNALVYLQKTASIKFDIIFLDPPFKLGLLEECCNLLESNNWLNSNALIYCENSSDISNLRTPTNWVLRHSKKASSVYYGLFKRCERLD